MYIIIIYTREPSAALLARADDVCRVSCVHTACACAPPSPLGIAGGGAGETRHVCSIIYIYTAAYIVYSV